MGFPFEKIGLEFLLCWTLARKHSATYGAHGACGDEATRLFGQIPRDVIRIIYFMVKDGVCADCSFVFGDASRFVVDRYSCDTCERKKRKREVCLNCVEYCAGCRNGLCKTCQFANDEHGFTFCERCCRKKKHVYFSSGRIFKRE